MTENHARFSPGTGFAAVGLRGDTKQQKVLTATGKADSVLAIHRHPVCKNSLLSFARRVFMMDEAFCVLNCHIARAVSQTFTKCSTTGTSAAEVCNLVRPHHTTLPHPPVSSDYGVLW